MTRRKLEIASTAPYVAKTTPISNSTNRQILCSVNKLLDDVLIDIFVYVRFHLWWNDS